MNYLDKIESYLALEQQVLKQLDRASVNELMNVLEQTRLSGHRVFICGNGGSAATASHFVCDFMKGVSLNQDVKYDFECLNDNAPLLMAVADHVVHVNIDNMQIVEDVHMILDHMMMYILAQS